MVARAIENAGIPTVTLNMVWVFQKIIGMPRIAAIEYPFGRPFGEVDDFDRQKEILQCALNIFSTAKEAGHIEHLPVRWHLDPKKTKWHPPVPAPIIEFMRREGLL